MEGVRDVTARPAARAARPKQRDPLPKTDAGAVCAQWVRCGKRACRCMTTGPRHGPYYYLFAREPGSGRLVKRYVRRELVEETRAACEAARWERRERREQQRLSRQLWRALLAHLREVEESW
jgi:hypothetical protein